MDEEITLITPLTSENLNSLNTNHTFKRIIKLKNPADKDYLYDFLKDPLSGGNCCLSGEKICVSRHKSISDLITFNLTDEEADEVNNLDIVESVEIEEKESLHYIIEPPIIGNPRIAKKNLAYFPALSSNSNQIPHHLHYCQSISATIATEDLFDNISAAASLSSIDCSDIDIVIFDTGIDTSHPDISAQCVEFDWTQLRDGPDGASGDQIVTSQSADYYTDTNGHGTSCAGVAAGRRTGFAKNAKLYALRSNGLDDGTDGFSTTECLELMVAFQKAKNSNSFGLSARRPTIMNNSWGYSIYDLPPLYHRTNVTNYFGASSDDGSGINNLSKKFNSAKWAFTHYYGIQDTSFTKFNYAVSTTDNYIRQAIDEGVHVITSAGNNNHYLENNDQTILTKRFTSSGGTNYYAWLDPQTNYLYNDAPGIGSAGFYNSNNDGTITGWSGGLTKSSTNTITYLSYGSPNIGTGYSKNDYPIINVGDCGPIGNFTNQLSGNESNKQDSLSALFYFNESQFDSAYRSAIGVQEKINNNLYIPDIIHTKPTKDVRYDNLSSIYIKSNYSNYGPDVDVYAPGLAAWSPMSNQSTTSSPTFTANNHHNEVYKQFGGTSSAGPVTVGCLATFLADNLSATNKESRDWIISSSLKGKLLQSKSNSFTLSGYNGSGAFTNFTRYYAPGLSSYNSTLMDDSNRKVVYQGTSLTVNKTDFYNESTPNDINLLAFHNSIGHDSHNRFVNAYPTRRAILSAIATTFDLSGTELTRSTSQPDGTIATH